MSSSINFNYWSLKFVITRSVLGRLSLPRASQPTGSLLARELWDASRSVHAKNDALFIITLHYGGFRVIIHYKKCRFGWSLIMVWAMPALTKNPDWYRPPASARDVTSQERIFTLRHLGWFRTSIQNASNKVTFIPPGPIHKIFWKFWADDLVGAFLDTENPLIGRFIPN